jgi:hypothetical protein
MPATPSEIGAAFASVGRSPPPSAGQTTYSGYQAPTSDFTGTVTESGAGKTSQTKVFVGGQEVGYIKEAPETKETTQQSLRDKERIQKEFISSGGRVKPTLTQIQRGQHPIQPTSQIQFNKRGDITSYTPAIREKEVQSYNLPKGFKETPQGILDTKEGIYYNPNTGLPYNVYTSASKTPFKEL